jgi:acyl dehydratase
VRAELRVTFTREQIAAYAEASGDHNPIHLDDSVARSVGLPGIIAHGMLQMGLAARVAVEAGGGTDRLRRLSCRFAGMVRPGDTVTFRAEEKDGRIDITALNQDGQPVLTKASAEVTPHPDPPPQVGRARPNGG